jgi:DNA-binding NarL/FixJ family response regulator
MQRIVIVDRYEVVRAGLRSVLAAHPNWDIVAEAEDGPEALRRVRRERPDLVITDYSVPLLNGAEITQQARKKSPDIKVLVFTQQEKESVFNEVLGAGALGLVLKSEPNDVLVQAVKSLCAGHSYFSAVVQQLRSSHATNGGHVLSPRETSVVQLIAEGHTNKQIAKLLCVSPKTIETHRFQAHQKLDLKSTASLVRYAIRSGLLQA